jgi:hypothetical protein
VRLSRLLVRHGVPAQAYNQATSAEVSGLIGTPTTPEPALAGSPR